ncbi:glycosyltransferase family 4 protein [Raineya orbicola]|jgi:glycosyltransferase involved in cell wall biosynthesis|uniref:Glycosyltransferase n=1 Tax=Raineya orbicola TaxID=2016530 RepID=A0A2N3II68_9BACT|nr:glycosyltransferase family 4 protein [Raineya orbicola]PKQ69948.1 Glycosyltransferase [Raineya orbicola]
MKVLFIFGGMPHYLRDLLNKLSQTRNLEVVVLLPEKKSSTIGSGVAEKRDDCHFKIIYSPETLLLGQKPHFPQITQILQQEQPQILVVGWPYILGIYLRPSVRYWLYKNKIKILYRSIPYQIPPYPKAMQFYSQEGFFDENMNHIKADTFTKKLKYWLITQINKGYFCWVDAHLNYCSKALDILPTYGVAKNKIFITYNSIDTDKILLAKEKLKNENKLFAYNPHRIIHVGRLVKWKKIDALLEVFAKVVVSFPQAELVLIGDGTEKNHLQQLAEKLHLKNKVKFLGGIYDSEVVGNYLQSSLACVLVGAGGLAINEAMAWGTPVICSEADGTEKDLITHQVTGFFFEKDNFLDLQNQIEYLLQNPQIAQKVGKNAENFIYTHINIHTVVQNFVGAFNEVTSYQYQLSYEPENLAYSRS